MLQDDSTLTSLKRKSAMKKVMLYVAFFWSSVFVKAIYLDGHKMTQEFYSHLVHVEMFTKSKSIVPFRFSNKECFYKAKAWSFPFPPYCKVLDYFDHSSCNRQIIFHSAIMFCGTWRELFHRPFAKGINERGTLIQQVPNVK